MKSKKFAGTQYEAPPVRATVLHPELLAKAIYGRTSHGWIITLEGQFFILIVFVTKFKYFYKTIKFINTSDFILFQKQITVQY